MAISLLLLFYHNMLKFQVPPPRVLQFFILKRKDLKPKERDFCEIFF
jgi:hypothetical protein